MQQFCLDFREILIHTVHARLLLLFINFISNSLFSWHIKLTLTIKVYIYICFDTFCYSENLLKFWSSDYYSLLFITDVDNDYCNK